MEDGKRPKEADWAPGTLDRTRKAIGDIDPAEAQRMSKKLGGEVMYEKSTHVAGASTKGTGRIVRNSPSGGGSSSSSSGSSYSSGGSSGTPTPSGKGRKRQEELPVIPQKLAQMIDKLMMSDEYAIKPDYGLFNFIKLFQQNGKEQVITEFCTITLKHHIDNLQGFITVVKTLIQMAPSTYKAKIVFFWFVK